MIPTPRPISPRFSAQLDCLRWISAFLVCITHLRSLVVVDYNPQVHASWVEKIFYALHGFGHECVIVFFVLSGYLIGGEVIREWQSRRFDWKNYTLRRASRIYPGFALALLIGGLLDKAGVEFFPATGLYHHSTDIPMIFYDVSTRLSLGVLTGNLLFCQELLVPTFGSNVSLWSLSYEAWYYVVFPLVVAVFVNARQLPRIWIHLVLLACVLYFIRGDVLLYMSIWLLGVAPHFVQRPLFKHAWPALLGVIACLLIVRFRVLSAIPVFWWHVIEGVCLALALNTWSHAKNGDRPLALARFHQKAASFSYSVYLLHWPLGLFLIAGIKHFTGYGLREPFNFLSCLYYASILLVIYIASWGFAHLSEYRTKELRNFLARRIS